MSHRAPTPFGFATFLAALSAVGAAHAEEFKLDVSGSVRARVETIEGQPRAGFNASDTLYSLRTRVLLEAKTGPTQWVAEIYDSRFEGEDRGTPISTNEGNALELVQAYVLAKTTLGESDWRLAGQAGRFTLNLGSRRLVANDDFRNTTNGFTGLKGTASHGETTLEAIYVFPQLRLPSDGPSLRRSEIVWDRESGDALLYGAILTRRIGPGALQATALHFDEEDASDAPTRNRDLETYGVRYFRDPAPGQWDFDVELFRQSGKIDAAAAPGSARLDVSAGFHHLELGRQWKDGWKSRLAVEYDRAGGDRPGKTYERFDPLFGMRRAELGPAGLYNAIGRTNVRALGVRYEVQPSARLDGHIALKTLRLDSTTDAFSTTGVRDPSGASGADAGFQWDLRARYWIVPDALRVDATAVRLERGRFLSQSSAGADDTTYVALDLTVVF